ncbi:fused MFS/spermidine synthase [Nocardioides massiliensis]|uniref:Spermidine synthase n=1 Tax=Nocardioides massiliensis TaxID=1325935 RepID=A0ABT9NP98_9ACTN|nr:fused MFS/spermidine synthase [Nocardioides massiliensis]MDP9821690.1 spermidine synthase [Nocardioides massiliensis]
MPARSLPRPVAVGLVFGCSAAVLVVELVALRLVAPYWGLTLETNTIVIGLALLAIAAGSWGGGRLADLRPPAGLLAPAIGVSGVVVAATPFLIRGAGATGDAALFALAVGVTLVVPGALLSAVTPVVTKLHLGDLDEAGSVVGRLSGVSTLGGITGTVLTGFVLVTALPVTAILVGLGLALVSTALTLAVRRTGGTATAPAVVAGVATAALLASGLSVLGPGDCDLETRYHCVELRAETPRDGTDRPAARTLVMDGLRHSYVDPDDPAYLDFAYVRALAAVVDAAHPGTGPLRAHHLGGAGLTYPRLLARTRPGTTGTASEIDAGLVRADGGILDASDIPGLTVRVEDGRRGLTRLPDDGLDLVVGDAFGGVSVPWHLTTREALSDVRRVLHAEGSYVANLIDHGPLDLARAQAATMAEVFDHVLVLLVDASSTEEFTGGNVILAGTRRPVPAGALEAALDTRDVEVTTLRGADLAAWVGDALVLRDDHAPVDQLLTPYPVS